MFSSLRSRRIAFATLAVVLVALIGETVVALRDSNAQPGPTVGSVYFPPGKRKPVTLPPATMLDGGTFDASSIGGHVTVVNFWAQWCPPCTAEAPTLQQIWSEKQTAGVGFLGIDAQESSPDPGRLFVASRGITYPNVYDGDGAMQLAFSRAVQLGNLPVTVVLDAQGKVGGVVYGEARYTQLSGLIDQVVAGSAA